MSTQPLNRTYSFNDQEDAHEILDYYRDSTSHFTDAEPAQPAAPPETMNSPYRGHTVSPPSPSHSRFNESQAGRHYGIGVAQAGGQPAFSRSRDSYGEPSNPSYYEQEQEGDNYHYYHSQQYPQHPAGPTSHSQLPPPPNSYGSPYRHSPQAASSNLPSADDQHWRQDLGYSNSTRSAQSATPGMDNLGQSAVGGGIAGIALGVAAVNERESGVQAIQGVDQAVRSRAGYGAQYRNPTDRGLYWPPATDDRHYAAQELHPQPSYSSTAPLGLAASMPGQGTPEFHQSDSLSMGSHPSQERFVSDSAGHYTDNPYNRYSTTWDPRVGLGGINPTLIADDGDDGLNYGPQDPKRRSLLSLGRGNSSTPHVAGAAGSGVALVGRGGSASRNVLQDPSTPGPDGLDGTTEKSEWLSQQNTGKKKLRWIVGIILALLILGGIAGGVVAGILGSKKNNDASKSLAAGNSTSSGQSAADDTKANGDLNKDSDEIKKLLNNPNFHKVFPGMDYTPLNAQYPDCLTTPTSQNNVTRDIAVLSQLTNQVRLYGTDCNQTDMVLHAFDALGLSNMKLWLGVWQESNATTNARQLDQMYASIDKYGGNSFAGVIVGNEVLFRKDMTEAQLATIISGVKRNLTSRGINIPVATSDLGDNWTAQLASDVDILMANIHPFFTGYTVDVAAGWTWEFFTNHDVNLATAAPNKPRSIISEVGWPSEGGNSCGAYNCTSPTAGSVAGIDQMNIFMDKFICQSMANGTDFFWFEAFDEPWKIRYDQGGQNWEDHWGLMDVNRNLKPGLKIPDCGGKTVS
ncbi:MAG: hypothetical protein M1829_005838 [Trizodia sp. TS-e1964]|nr:MAG: hypothetical protein M1829_005838 [Trizodia sp. TS-e1964]